MKSYKILAFGKVQGVGYRRFVQELASSCDFNGNVKNLQSGEVEILINMNDADLGGFLDSLQVGNGRMETLFFQVHILKTPNSFDGFSIVR